MTAINKVGVIGAGTMGNGIAQACATSGLRAVMIDVAEAAIERGTAAIDASLDRLVKKEKIKPSDKAAALNRVEGTTDYAMLATCDFVIEAATENEEVK